jgi:hypothetical protein
MWTTNGSKTKEQLDRIKASRDTEKYRSAKTDRLRNRKRNLLEIAVDAARNRTTLAKSAMP